jgi:hypothetical protein
MIVTAQGAPKIATNKRSPRAPQPSAASAESVASSPTPGSIYRILFISHLFWKRPDPPGCEAQGGPGLAMTAFRPVTERPVMTKTILVEAV